MTSAEQQPPTGVTRNLTEVFVLLRNNAMQNKFMYHHNAGASVATADERMSLVELDEDLNGSSRIPPEWVNVLDEIQYDLTRVRTRLKQLRDMQHRHMQRPSFTDEASNEEQSKIDSVQDEVTSMLNHCQRLINIIEKAQASSKTQEQLKQNVVNSLLQALQGITADFRSNQAKYLMAIESRRDNVNTYLLEGSNDWLTTEVLDSAPQGGEMSMAQIQELLDNAGMVKQREREVLSVSRSIVELNSLFKDLAAMVVDQGTLLDRIDYNVEQTTVRVKSGLRQVEKAERYQRSDRKMQCILCLSVAIIIVLLLLIVLKT